MNARTTLEVMSWDATMTLSRLTSLRETFSISMLVTSVWLDVSKHVERLVSCLQDLGESSKELALQKYPLPQGPPVLPLQQCRAPNRVHARLGHVWDILPPNTNVTAT